MTPRLHVDAKRLQLVAGKIDETRVLTTDDHTRFASWRDHYQRLVRIDGRSAEFLKLGRDMHAWLDGAGGWMKRLRGTASPLLLELVAPAEPDATTRPFLEAPWELLADDQGHLAGDPAVRFTPIRRLGTPDEPAPPSPHGLAVIFMAAAPRGGDNLQYEAEESAILNCAGSIGLDLTVEDSGGLEPLAERIGADGPFDVLHVSCHGTNDPVPALLLEDEIGKAKPATAADLIRELPAERPRLLFLSACHTAARRLDLQSLCTSLLQAGLPAVLGWDGAVRDGDATHFARELYRRLAKRDPLEAALAEARFAVLRPNPQEARPAEDWHLARLYLRPDGGGRLCQKTNRDGGARRSTASRRSSTSKAAASRWRVGKSSSAADGSCRTSCRSAANIAIPVS